MNIKQINNLVLAYYGDAIYEIEVRKFLINKGINKVNDLQKEAIKYVSAKAQAEILEKLIAILTEEEFEIVKKARNMKVHSKPKNTDIQIYKLSTGFEALIGYLSLTNNEIRVNEIFNYIFEGEELWECMAETLQKK